MKKKVIYFSLLILAIIFVSTAYYSYAFFTNQVEGHGKLNIVAGTLDYQIESSDLKNHQMIVNPNSTYELEIEIDSFNTIDSKYELYYLLDKEVNDFKIGYFEVTEDLPTGEISTNGRKKIKVGIQNFSTEMITVTFGVEGGFTNQDLILKKGRSLTLLDYCRIGETRDFAYTGTSQTFTTQCSGTYQVELWGAQGGVLGDSSFAGKGSYTKGNIQLKIDTSLYVYVGEQGFFKYTSLTSPEYTFNGGASGSLTCLDYYQTYGQSISGGGATDIRLVNGDWDSFDSLKSRIMVAAGGGGGYNNEHYAYGGSGGGIEGYDGLKDSSGGISTNYGGLAASQKLGGNSNGAFGKGGVASLNTICSWSEGAGGGSGYYGGGGSRGVGNNTAASGAGGSSFISGHDGCDAIDISSTESAIIHTGQSIHYSNFYFTDTLMIDGNGYQWTTKKENYMGMPSYKDSSTMIGNTGNGYAKITYLGN